ncbi:MAG TPA: tRNA (adenosine(37)-N6)-threonylcarbamoyltransferase complex dimerization subunit type 1 TsaB [Anaerolineales bacterium]|nr:tRNA (adenosine(37)-N6)-threonylcarbamoyltransferase complex dimerization subunit type 1 TsaB [Anaerolineales bacterium]
MLLAVDTSTRTIGLALYDGVQVICENTWASRDYHTVELAPALADALARARVQMSDLKILAVALGPGSFTGLRIGLALVKGIALARHLPVIGIPTLDALAASQPVRQMPLIAILNAGRGRLAVGRYQAGEDNWQPSTPAEVLDIERLSRQINQPTLVCGELTEEERRILARKHKNVVLASPAHTLRRPAFLAELAWQQWQGLSAASQASLSQASEIAALSPLYLHVGDPIPG